MAIAMAQAGGIGVIHRNLEPEEQAAQVRQVKKFESGMVVNPLTIAPDATLSDALALMKEHGISGIPVVERRRVRRAVPGKLVGILTNRDVRFATDPRQKVAELMTQGEPRHRARRRQPGRGQAAAASAPHRKAAGGRRPIPLRRADHRQGHGEGGRPSRTPARTSRAGCGSRPRPRSARPASSAPSALIEAGVDLVVVDTAHGHSRAVLEAVNRIKRLSNAVQVVAGNIATAEGAQGADRRRRRCHQGRHRSGLDLHHADRRRRRRAAAHRHHGCGRGGAHKRHAR